MLSRICLVPSNSHAFIDLYTAFLVASPWHAVCTTAVQQTRLASRGGRNPTSTGVPVLGGQFKKGGLHQPPFLFSRWLVASRGWSQIFKGAGLRSCAFALFSDRLE